MKSKHLQVPTDRDWNGYEHDLDLIDFYKLVYGKKVEDVYYYFKNAAHISLADELLYSNRKVFQYYIFAFALYLMLMGEEDIEAQEGFLSLLLNREERDQGSVRQIFHNKYKFDIIDANFSRQPISLSLEDVVDSIYKKVKEGHIDTEIYDDIPKFLEKIKKTIT